MWYTLLDLMLSFSSVSHFKRLEDRILSFSAIMARMSSMDHSAGAHAILFQRNTTFSDKNNGISHSNCHKWNSLQETNHPIEIKCLKSFR